MKSPSHQMAFRILTSHPECLADDESLDPLLDDIAAAIDAAGKCIYPNCNTGSDPLAKIEAASFIKAIEG